MKQLVTYFLLALFALPAYSAEVITLSLKPNAVIEGASFKLADIATVSGEDKELIGLLAELKIGYTPRRGLSKTYRTDEIEQVILAAHQNTVAIDWQGSEQCEIKSQAVEFYLSSLHDDIEQTVLAYLIERDDGFSMFDIQTIDTKAKIYLSGTQFEHRLHFPARLKVGSRLTVLLDIFEQGKRVSSSPVTIGLKVARPVYVLSEDVARRAGVTKAALDLIQRDVTAIYADVLSPDFDFSDVMMLTEKNENDILMRKDVIKKPFVMKGDITDVTVVSEKVTIEVQAVAQNDAYQGEAVALMNKSGAIFNAVVVEKGRAYVE